MFKTISGLALVALLTVGLIPPPFALAGAAASDPSLPVVVRGPVGGATDISAVTFFIHPTDAVLRALPIGSASPPLVERSASDFTVKDGEYVATLDPAAVPDGYMDDEGVVFFDVIFDTAEGTYLTSTSARAVSVAPRDIQWADAANSSSWGVRHGRKAVGGRSLSRPPSVDIDEPEVEYDGVPAGEPMPAGGFDTPTGCTDTKLSTKIRSTTIGTAYPLAGDKAWMDVNSSQGASYGVAFSVKAPSGAWGEFRASEDKFTKSSWGFEWAKSGRARSFRKGVEYGLFERTCYAGCTRCQRFWVPIGETGGTGNNWGITRPDWTYCQGVAPGAWWRGQEGGKNYTYGSAVKFAGVIGLDLSISRSYSGQQRLYYELPVRRRLCGNNGNPAVAGKIMERLL